MNYTKLFFLAVLTSLFSIACGGNNNTCPACDQTPDNGPCKALIPKYYFDKAENKCKEFSWGGCDGVVPFETLAECEACDCKN